MTKRVLAQCIIILFAAIPLVSILYFIYINPILIALLAGGITIMLIFAWAVENANDV